MVRLDLVFMLTDIYINSYSNLLTKFNSCRRSTKFKDVSPWKISQMIMKTVAISMRILISYVMKRGISFRVWPKVNGIWDNMTRISQWRESHYKNNSSIRRKKEIKVTDLSQKWHSESIILVGKLIIWVRKFEVEKLKKVYQFHQNRFASLYTGQTH